MPPDCPKVKMVDEAFEAADDAAYVASLAIALLSCVASFSLLVTFSCFRELWIYVQISPVMWMILCDFFWAIGVSIQIGYYVFSGFTTTLAKKSQVACVAMAMTTSQFLPTCSFFWWTYITINVLRVMHSTDGSARPSLLLANCVSERAATVIFTSVCRS